MKRRLFLTRFSAGWLISLIPMIVTSCFSKGEDTSSARTNAPTSTANPPRSDGFEAVGTVAELDKQGQIAKKTASAPIIVIRNPDKSDTLSAVNSTCTHKGCIVAWKASQKEFVCPCHGSDFAPDGKVLEGPAKTPLKTYQAKIESDTVLVKLT